MIDTKELRKLVHRHAQVALSIPIKPAMLSEILNRLEATEKDAAELEARCATLADALRSTAQTLAWMQHGKCRGFSDDLLTTNEALEKARAALEKLK